MNEGIETAIGSESGKSSLDLREAELQTIGNYYVRLNEHHRVYLHTGETSHAKMFCDVASLMFLQVRNYIDPEENNLDKLEEAITQLRQDVENGIQTELEIDSELSSSYVEEMSSVRKALDNLRRAAGLSLPNEIELDEDGALLEGL